MPAASRSSASPCAIKPAISVRPKTVSVNGVDIPRAAIARETQNHPAATPIEAWKAAARALAIRELLLQEARRLAVQAEPLADAAGRRETMEEALVRALVEQEVTVPAADEAACRRYYAGNLRRFRSPDLFEVSHILLAAAPRDGDGRAAARIEAEALIEILRSTPGDFAMLAKRCSACPSREVGGSLGQIGPGQTVPEFERALPQMPVGAVHGSPVESRYGLHVVRVNRREEGRQLPFEIVRQRIAAYLDERVRRTAIRHFISILAGRAAIVGIELAASDSPLVQ
jgi:peptidyl-prolyl cis-trans isomerase C